MSTKPLRIGALGCANIVKESLYDVPPIPEVTLIAIASRSEERARAFAAQYSIPKYYGSYEALLRDPEVEVVYVPLPHGLHAEWTICALQAGKPVVCQKPIAANEKEGYRVLAAARAADLPVIEAWHYRYHPMAHRIRQILDSGVLGTLRTIESRFRVPGKWVTGGADNIRLRYELAGGCLMDPGGYCVDILRWATGAEPTVKRAKARLFSPDVDVAMEAELLFPGGLSGRLETSLDYDGDALDEVLKVGGDKGEMEAISPGMPQWGQPSITLTLDGKVKKEQIESTSTFVFMWPEIVKVVREGLPIRTTVESGIKNQKVTDDIYKAAGMRLRGGR